MTSTTTERATYPRVVILGPAPPEVDKLIARRQELGQDRFDEVWEGEYHMVPGPDGKHGAVDFQIVALLAPLATRAGLQGRTQPNIGEPDDYRVPDQAYFTTEMAARAFHPTAALVVEVLSPGDESRGKLRFYFACGVAEVVLVDPATRVVEWYLRRDGGLPTGAQSPLLGILAAEVADQNTWP